MGEVLIDRDNAIEITELKIQLEAVEDKIIVVMDNYKSGYECEECGGTGSIKSIVPEAKDKICPKCEGRGALLVVPEISKSLPTLGTVVSLGPKCQWCQKPRNAEDRKDILIRPGAKVLFQPHVGTLIPFKGNIRLKIMREHEPLAVLYGAVTSSKDFLEFDTPFEERY